MKIKALKVFYNGTRLKDIYPHCTRWELFKYRFLKFTKKVLVTSFILGLIYGAFHLGRATTEPVKVFADREVDVSAISLQNKIDDLKNGVADSLMACESGGAKESDALVTYDPRQNESVNSNIPSFGMFQFKKATVIFYYKSLYNTTITPLEAVKIALDEEKARTLAKDVMFKTKNKAGKDWHNCSERLNLDERINLIKQLEK